MSAAAAASADRPLPQPGEPFAGHRIVDVLGDGAFSRVFRAEGPDGLCALKVPRDGGGPSLIDEAAILAGLRHPNIVALLGQGVAHDQPYLALELCAGQPLSAWIAGGPTPAPDAAEILRQIALGLAHAHARGVVHRDLKPTNVAVDRGPDGIVVKLLDFGASALHRSPEQPIGTLLYMSPEQLGLIDAPIDGRSDLYALGALAVELLAGVHPFAGLPVSALVHAHAAQAPACPKGVPACLAAVVTALCEKDPERRYVSAEGVAADLTTCLTRMAAGEDTAFPLTRSGQAPPVGLPRFHGRDEVLAALEAARDAARTQLQVLAVGGLSGIGKSAVVRAAVDGWSDALTLTSRGRAYGQASAYGLFAEALEALARLDLAPAHLARIRDAVGLLGAEITRLVPALAPRLGPCEDPGELEPEQRRQRFFAVMTRLLAALPSAEQPLVLFFDDAQWADEGSLELLAHLTRADSPLQALVVLTYRTDPHEADGAARALRAVHGRERRIELAPLSAAAIRALVGSMLGANGADDAVPDALVELVELVEARAGGSPLYAQELVRSLVDGGALVHDPRAGWRVDAPLMARIGHGASLHDVIAQRLSRLAPSARRVLTVAAAIGRTFHRTVLAQVASADATDAVDAGVAIDRAAAAHLVRRTGTPGEWEFTHDKVREALFDRLDQPTRTALHAAVGHALEATFDGDPPPKLVFALAYHFERSDDPARAVRYGALAGDQSLAAHAHAEALEFFAAAHRRAPDGPARARLAEGMADAHRMLGQYDAALAGYASAAAHSTSLDAARIAGKVGGVYFGRGEAARAADAMIEALEALGERFPRGMLGVCWMIAAQCAVQLVYTLRRPRRPVSRDPVKIEIGRIYGRLAYVFYFLSIPRLAAAHLRHLNLMERDNVESELGQAYSNHGPIAATVPLRARALAYARESLSLRQRLGDRFGAAQSRSFYTVTLTNLGRYDDALTQGAIARQELIELGDRWELVTVLSQIAMSQVRLGHWADAEQSIAEITQHATASRHSAGLAYAAWTGVYMAARTGTQAGIDAILARLPACEGAGDAFSVIQLLQSLGRLYLRTGDVPAGIEALERAIRIAHAHLIRSDFVAVAYPALAEAYVLALEACTDPAERARWAWRCRRALAWAFAQTLPYRNEVSYTWRVGGRFLRAIGRPRAARAALHRAHTVALDQGQPYLQALALVELGGLAPDSPGGRAALRSAEQLLAALGAREDLDRLGMRVRPPDGATAPPTQVQAVRHAAQLQELLDVGQRLSAIGGLDELLDQILRSAVRVLGAERGVLFLLEPGPDGGAVLQVRASHAVFDGEQPAATSVATRALAGGRTLVLADAQSDEEFHAASSVIASGVRSVLCAPLRFKDRALGVLYLDNRLIRGVFDEDSLRLLEALASQAAVTLTNARAFAALEAENRARLLSERQAQAASLAKSTFLANMSHELRTPLNAILGYTEMALESLASDPSEPVSEDLDRVCASARHLLALIQDVLDLSRIEAGHLPIQVEAVALGPIVAQAVITAAPSAAARRNRVVSRVEPGLVALADAGRLAQVLLNLLVNAIKFTDAGAIEIGAAAVDGGVCAWVSDTGIGIHEADQGRVFERFQQVDDAPTRKHGGTGLGLAICRELVGAMGGRMTLESALGEGTTVRVFLRAPEASAASTAAPAPHRAASN